MRFRFGENWAGFLKTLDDSKIAQAEASLNKMLGVESLQGKSFVDIGCGSGLFSLAAMRLMADRVSSFDYDEGSVACAQALRSQYFPRSPRWEIQRGDVLDKDFMETLGSFDIVYAWGVLHRTGDMWTALGNACLRVASEGRLCVAIYNDQGPKSKIWLRIKRVYCLLPEPLSSAYTFLFFLVLNGFSLAKRFKDFHGNR